MEKFANIAGSNSCLFRKFPDFGRDNAKPVTLIIQPQIGEEAQRNIVSPIEALDRLKASYRQWESNITKMTTDYEPLARLVSRGIGDLRVLLTELYVNYSIHKGKIVKIPLFV